MSTRAERRLRLVLAAAAVPPLLLGLLATLAPRTFFDDFPFLANWVALLPPYNKHLTTDVGGLQLAFGLLLAYAAWRPSRTLVVPVCLAWAGSQVLHVLFHVTHLDGFGVADAVGQTVALVAVTALPLAAVWLVTRTASEPQAEPRASRTSRT